MSGEMVITFPEGNKVDAHFGGFTVNTDQDGSAPPPFAFFLASIGTCAGIYVSSFCRNRGIPVDNVRIMQRVSSGPMGGIGKVELEIQVPPDFPEKYHQAIIRAADECAVKRTIQNPPEFEVKTVVV